MLLFLVRHGEAEVSAATDRERCLTARGRNDNDSVIAQLMARTERPARLIASPFKRAQQSLDQYAQALPALPASTSQPVTPDADPRALLAALDDDEPMNTMLVSHNPLMSRVLALLTDGNFSGAFVLGTSELACVELDVLAPACGELRFLLRPGA